MPGGRPKLTLEQFIEKANRIHNNFYDYSKSICIDAYTELEIRCPKHNKIFWATPVHHFLYGCKDCGNEKGAKTRTCSIDIFIEKANKVHNNFYDYSKSIYIKGLVKTEIYCPKHQKSFWLEPTIHLQGAGCRDCGFEKTGKGLVSNTTRFIEKANEVHNFRYDYSLAIYGQNNAVKINIICKKHGIFPQTPAHHLNGEGCPKCIKVLEEDFIERAKSTYSNKFQYDRMVYISFTKKIEIFCIEHNRYFWQMPYSHLNNDGCPCRCPWISKSERKWLDYINIPDDPQHRQVIILGTHTDGFIPETNTIYEFNGDYYHGNPTRYNPQDTNPTNHKTYGKLYAATLQREQLLRNAGYNVVSIWESDWLVIQKQLKKEAKQAT
jgi:hypothetical protein